jgi:hypothetical protein
MSTAEWRPPRRFQIDLFHIDHAHHGTVQREEIAYTPARQFNVPGLTERWKPGAVFIALKCSKCGAMLMLDTVQGQP